MISGAQKALGLNSKNQKVAASTIPFMRLVELNAQQTSSDTFNLTELAYIAYTFSYVLAYYGYLLAE